MLNVKRSTSSMEENVFVSILDIPEYKNTMDINSITGTAGGGGGWGEHCRIHICGTYTCSNTLEYNDLSSRQRENVVLPSKALILGVN